MGKSILAVDDEEGFLEFVVRTLSSTKHRLTTAKTVDEALASARRDPPDLILLDIGLPGLDGHDLCEMLREDGIPILCVSGHPFRQERLSVEYSGAVGYVEKPVKPEELLAAVKRALRTTSAAAAPRPAGEAEPRRG